MNVQDRSERAFGISRFRRAASYEHVGAGIVEIDQDGRILRVDQYSCELTGYSAPELLGRSIFEETHPDDVEHDRAQFNRQLAGEIDRYTLEKRLRMRSGDFYWAEVTSSSVRGAEGKFLYAVRVQHDITARKEAEFALARRMDEQAALFQFSECLQHVVSVEEIYEVALEAIMRALDCERASILMSDQANVMRFVAWRGLSEEYRKAVEGHSPWASEERSPQPVLIEDVEASALPSALKEVVAREGIAALVFIPILQNGRLAGKFMAYYDRPYRLGGPQVEVALTLARQLSFSAARLKAEEARSQAERERRQAETQQRLLLDELNHRTKNNMQILLSLLSRAASNARGDEARRVLEEACGRIAAMAAAQRVLYGRADASRFDPADFLTAVCQTLQQTLPAEVKVACKPGVGVLPNDAAMPLALIVNELVTNAVEHGLKDKARPHVRIGLGEQDGELTLSVEDDGEGFDLNAVRKTSSGLQLVSGLARQLQGSFEVTRNPSTACLRFPVPRRR